MVYAPVLIPTLNRIAHLKRCIESLKGNSYSSETELFISVDYPPTDGKYDDGYEDVVRYVKSITGFKRVYSFFQTENLSPSGNNDFLYNQMLQHGYDRYIFTEDDNEFSPNFLEYMDKGLQRYKNNDSIIAICCTEHFFLDKATLNGTYFFTRDYAPYGVGHWVRKNQIMAQRIKQGLLDEILSSNKMLHKIFVLNPNIYHVFSMDVIREYPAMRDSDDRVKIIDGVFNLYCITDNKYCIYPYKNMVRNWGRDGSGVNCSKDDINPLDQELDDALNFDFIKDSNLRNISQRNMQRIKIYYSPKITTLIRAYMVIKGKKVLNDHHFKVYLNCLKRIGNII